LLVVQVMRPTCEFTLENKERIEENE